MTVQFRRLRGAILRVAAKATWPWLFASLGLLFIFGAIAMPLAETAGSPLASPANYVWWFVVTATTVGYGDFAPASTGGRVVAAVIMIFATGLMAVTVAKLADSVIDFGRKRMKGLDQLDEKNHLVILGYAVGDTELLVRELRADERDRANAIVLCSDLVDENPIPSQIKFVRGEPASDDVMRRACLAAASRVVVHCSDDNETLVAVLAAHSANPDAHIVALVRKPESRVHIKRIHPEVECVMPLSVPLMVQSIQDRGATAVISSLLSNAVDDTIFRVDAPKHGPGWTFGALQRMFKERLGATLVAVGADDGSGRMKLNPDTDYRIAGGAGLFYIAPRRLEAGAVPWDEC